MGLKASAAREWNLEALHRDVLVLMDEVRRLT
jgi:hypothetical protein